MNRTNYSLGMHCSVCLMRQT